MPCNNSIAASSSDCGPWPVAELGLNEALAALVRLWRDAHPGVEIKPSISQSLGARGETAELTIYRVVQEALTNVFRHSGATHVDISVDPAPTSAAGTVEPAALWCAFATTATACHPIISSVSA